MISLVLSADAEDLVQEMVAPSFVVSASNAPAVQENVRGIGHQHELRLLQSKLRSPLALPSAPSAAPSGFPRNSSAGSRTSLATSRPSSRSSASKCAEREFGGD
jgi:hypothetical protein